MKTTDNTPPSIDGTHAKAWALALNDMEKAHVDQSATLCGWVVNAPWSHPFWPFVVVFCVHLRDIPGQSQPPVKSFPQATHEIGVYALNPEHYPPELDGSLKFLHPANYVGQFFAENDQMAIAMVESSVIEITRGELNPDSDGRMQWKMRYGDTCFKKCEPGSIDEIVSNGGTVVMIDGQPIMIIQPEAAPNPDTKH